MTVEGTAIPEQKPNDKELNFRALEAKFQKQLEQERAEKIEMQRQIQELKDRTHRSDREEEDDAEPYVDHKKFEKKLAAFEKKLEEKIDKRSEEKSAKMIEKERQQAWLDNHSDFYEVMQQNAEKLMQKAPQLADAILRMPEGFERQKLVYYNIKSLGIDKPEQKQPSVQEKIDANRRGPFYQPPTMGTAPYAGAGDFSPEGQKNAYTKLQELKSRLRI